MSANTDTQAERDHRHYDNHEYAHKHGLDKLWRPEEVNELLDKILDSGPRDEKQVRRSFHISVVPWPPINEVEAFNRANAQWRDVVQRHRLEEI